MKTKLSWWEKIKSWLKIFWPLLIPIGLIFSGITGFPYPSVNAVFSDLTISHYPNALFLRRALISDGVVPLWSPTILGGYPFAANPLAGMWYPPGWLALIFPLPLGFNITVILHILWGGFGMYTLLHRERLSHPAALFGALAFESMPKVFAHYGAGHLTLVYALMWTPWLLVATYQQDENSHWRKALSPGIILALIFLADPRWAVYAGLIWLSYAFLSWRILGEKLRSLLTNIIFQSVLALLLASPLAIPLMEYTRLSTRSALTTNDVLSSSLPPFRLLSLLVPDFGGYHEWILYPGGVVLVLALIALLVPSRRVRFVFWVAVIIAALLVALGEYLPGMAVLAKIPGFNLLRVPPRALFLTGLAWAAVAAYGLDILLDDRIDFPMKRVKLTLVGFFVFVFALTLGIGVFLDHWARNYLLGIGLIFAAMLGIWLLLGKKAPSSVIIILLIGISLLDWGQMNATLLTFRAKPIVLKEGGPSVQFLAMMTDSFRVYSPSYSLPQQTAALFGISLVDGVDPLQLASYAEFMEDATGVPFQGYSVTLPPFANADIQSDNAIYRPDAALLGLLNVRYIVAAFDLPVDGFVLREKIGETRVYENMKVASRAWVQIDDRIVSEAEITHWEPNKINLIATGPGILVLSEVAYPGWRVFVDGEDVPIEVYNDLMRAVQLAPGNHEITFAFYPVSVYIGLTGFILGAIGFFFSIRKEIRRK